MTEIKRIPNMNDKTFKELAHIPIRFSKTSTRY
jgi:hypothetical protein